jgi:hypothetical protein
MTPIVRSVQKTSLRAAKGLNLHGLPDRFSHPRAASLSRDLCFNLFMWVC